MKKTKTPQTPQLQEPDTQSKRRLSLPKVAYSAFLCVMMSMIFCQPAYAATDVWTKAKEIMQDVYTQILAISTIAAIVTASVALLLMNFSRSGRTVDESRAWLKRICITWAILNGLGFIMAYVTPLFKRNLLTGGAASCYPFTSYEMCDDNGILLGVNKYNSSLIIVDIFNSAVYKNANMSILGTSGAGKTFTMQLMALRMRRKNIPIFIVAPLKGHEFHRACSNVGGSFIQISPASPHCINVMEIRRVDRSVNEILDGPGIQLSELAAKIQQLHIFFSLLIPDMSHEERQLLDEALVRTYNTKGITHDNASLEDPAKPGQYREMPVLGDLYKILKTSKETMRMAHILNRLVNGSASTFNKQTNVRLDNKYTVLDISSLTGDLLTVGMFVALDFVWDRAKADRTEEKAIFIDECWQLLSGAGAAGVRLAGDFLLEIAKTIRGYGGASIFASQDLADFFDLDGGRFGKGIINNSKTKIILNLEDDEAQRVQEALHLSDAETMEITHFERGHGLISTNNNNIMVEFKASPLEKDLITTDRRELREIVERKRREQSTSAEQQI